MREGLVAVNNACVVFFLLLQREIHVHVHVYGHSMALFKNALT